jgi:hypothetical protein
MLESDWKQYDKYKTQVIKLKVCLFNLDCKSDNNEDITEIGWLNLSFGNGSWNKPVLYGKDNMFKVKCLIEKLLKKEIEDLENKMINL